MNKKTFVSLAILGVLAGMLCLVSGFLVKRRSIDLSSDLQDLGDSVRMVQAGNPTLEAGIYLLAEACLLRASSLRELGDALIVFASVSCLCSGVLVILSRRTVD